MLQSPPQYLTLLNQGDIKCKYMVHVQKLFYSAKTWIEATEMK